MRVLITGGAGFIGSHTTDLLLEKGFDVRVLDNLLPQIHPNGVPTYLSKKAEFVNGDVSRQDTWVNALKDVDVIIHLASLTGIAQSMYEISNYISANTIGTANMYQTILKNQNLKSQIKKIVIASSKTIYGEGSYFCKDHGVFYPSMRTIELLKSKKWDPACPQGCEASPISISENKPADPRSIYALTKADVEKMANYFSILGIPTVVYRYFSVFGPRQSLSNPYSGVCSIFISRIKNGQQPIIFEDGNQVRDFVYVKDVAEANLLAIEKDASGIFNIGSGTPTSIHTMAQLVARKLDSKIQSQITNEFRVGDTRSDFADISKAKKDLGFKPKWNVDQGLEKLIEWSETEKPKDLFDQTTKERNAYFGGV